jgi:multicomponent Na+:H+ antiporter subunit E
VAGVTKKEPAVPAWERWALSVLSRGLLMVLGWWALSGGDLKSWWLSVLLIAAAIASSYVVVGPGYRRWHPLAMARFGGFFAVQSLLGGVDVARRAFDPRMPIKPGFVHHELHVPSELSEVLIADTASLLPGTVGVELEDGGLTLHVLDTDLPVHRTIDRLERRITDLLGEPLTSDHDADPHEPSDASPGSEE